MDWGKLQVLVCSACLGVVACSAAPGQEPGSAAAFRFQAINEKSLGLWQGELPVLVYNHGAITPPGSPGGRGRACYFHPVYGLDGEVLTDDFPKDHTYHRGIYFAWPHIKVGDEEYETWTARGDLKQVFVRFAKQQIDERGAKLVIENAWELAGKPVMSEQIDVHVHGTAGDSRSIDIRATWTPLVQPIALSGAEGKSYGGFNVRFGTRSRPSITIPAGTEVAAGSKAEDGRLADDLLMTKLPWVDYSGEFAGASATSGAAIFVHPQHRDFPPTWMVRHYGLAGVGWPGVNPQTFGVGERLSCEYRLWIHRGPGKQEQFQAAYLRWTQGK